VFKLERFELLVPILANSANVWKFVKMIFLETIQNENREAVSQECMDMFVAVLKNKQYFISPIEGLVHNEQDSLAQNVMKYAIDNGIMHKLCNVAKKNDLYH